ncbi:uncharacterized protein LOC131875213 [Cryptomeria japonica]|uniref:uncharacterized protein LOC131875213 n=1 Tax=Cryptomeria japonica TaxID=3369 RepID=UPI0027D9FCE0|nr:uncharacterized protein LOC131875213 [Cryptomeria japonica]
MVAKLKAKLLPGDYSIQLYKKLQNLRQKEMDVKAYTEEFYKLSIRANHEEDETKNIARYINGLRFNIQDELSLTNPKIVEESFQLALKAKDKLKKRQEKQGRDRGRSNFRRRVNFLGRGQSQRSQGETSESQESFKSETRGGFRGRRPNFRGRFGGQRGGSNAFTIKCYKCNKFDSHQDWQCPKNKATTPFSGERRNQIAKVEDSESVTSPNQEVAPNVGESIMMRRTLIKVPIEKEPPQRKSLFRTTCKSQGKCCKVVIDYGSTDNLVSMEMVEKLNLKRIPHTKPYKVTWLNKGQQVLVNEQCWVEFHIGGYKDKVLCDSIPMDVCHILLGRPWQYDKYAKHDGRKNTYVIEKDGVTFTITPLKDEEPISQARNSVILVGEKEFLKSMEEKIGFAVLIRPNTIVAAEKVKEVPQEVQKLLNKYEDIVVDELPSSLLPMRYISHCIDFIPGANLPNKANL